MTDDLTLYRVTTGGTGHNGRKPWKHVKILRKLDVVQSYLRNQMYGDAYAETHEREPTSYTKVHTITIKEDDWQEWVNPDQDKLEAEMVKEADAMRESFQQWKDWRNE